MRRQWNDKAVSLLITILLCLVSGLSLIAIFRPASHSADCFAEIYQDGELLASIPLDGSRAPYRFTVTGENGCVNELEVRPDSIGIVAADCPDKLCVQQGFIDNAKLPIVCLPNRLVIRLRETDTITVDTVTY